MKFWLPSTALNAAVIQMPVMYSRLCMPQDLISPIKQIINHHQFPLSVPSVL